MPETTVTSAGNLEQNMALLQAAIPGALVAAGMVVIVKVQRIHVMFRPVGWAFGHMVRSYIVGPPAWDGSWYRVKVGPTVKYAWWAHFGRGPGGFPPPPFIRAWVKEKHIAESWVKGAKFRGYPRYRQVGTPQALEKELDSIVYLIGRSIAEKGTRGFPALSVAFQQAKPDAVRVFWRALSTNVAFLGQQQKK